MMKSTYLFRTFASITSGLLHCLGASAEETVSLETIPALVDFGSPLQDLITTWCGGQIVYDAPRGSVTTFIGIQ